MAFSGITVVSLLLWLAFLFTYLPTPGDIYIFGGVFSIDSSASLALFLAIGPAAALVGVGAYLIRKSRWPWIVVGSFLFLSAIFLVVIKPLYIVGETEQVIITRFGAFQRTERRGGIHVKVPFIEQVQLFSMRVLIYDAPPRSLITSDKKNLVIDAYACYRIVDPRRLRATVVNALRADARVGEVVSNQVRNNVASHPEADIISASTRAQMMKDVTQQAAREVKEFGVDLLSVGIRLEGDEQICSPSDLTPELLSPSLPEEGILANAQEYAVDVDTGEIKQLPIPARPKKEKEFRPSPDGKWRAFRRGPSLWVANADGSGERLLVDKDDLTPANLLEETWFLWSPDSQRVAYRIRSDSDLVNVVDVPTGQWRTLDPPMGRSFSWSPDGSKLSGLNQRTLWEGDLVVAEAATGHTSVVATGVSLYDEPQWSQDSNRLAYRVRVSKENSDLWVVNADGSGQRSLVTSPEFERAPSWSLDGKSIAFWRGGAVYLTPVETGRERQLARFEEGFSGWPGLQMGSGLQCSPEWRANTGYTSWRRTAPG